MCMIMSLNVNEMELKDPTQRTLLWKETREEKKENLRLIKTEKCQGYVHLCEHKHLTS